jgi:hypothetical protein
MVRSAVADDRLLLYFNNVAKQNTYSVGLILGQVILTSLSTPYVQCPNLIVVIGKRLRHTLCQNAPGSLSGRQRRPQSGAPYKKHQRHRRRLGGGPCAASHQNAAGRHARFRGVFRGTRRRPQLCLPQNPGDFEPRTQAPRRTEVPVWESPQQRGTRPVLLRDDTTVQL